MNSTTISNLLTKINKSLQLGKKIDKDIVEGHAVVLIDVHDSYYAKIIKRVIETWKFSSLPKPADIKEIYDSIKGAASTENKSTKYAKHEAYVKYNNAQRKNRHEVEIKDFIRRVASRQPLTESQQRAYDQIRIYFKSTPFDGLDAATELQRTDEKKLPFLWSFIGLYMDFLEGRLPKLTGQKRGNIFLPSTAKKPYNEAEYAKEKARQRSLALEKMREEG